MLVRDVSNDSMGDLKYMNFQIRINMELVRFGSNCDWNGQVVKSIHTWIMTFNSNGQIISSLTLTMIPFIDIYILMSPMSHRSKASLP